MVELIIELKGRVICQTRIDRDLMIGRSTTADICLEAPSVSRLHCRVSPRAGAVFIEDLGSLAGTRINGERVNGERRIVVGDTITIGAATLRLADGLRAPGSDLSRPAAPNRPPVTGNFLDENTSPEDEGSGSGSPSLAQAPKLETPARLEVTDHDKLEAALSQVKVGRSFVFIEDASALAPKGVMSRLFGSKQKRGREVRALVGHTPVELPGGRLVPAVLDVERLACLVADRDLYRVEQDIVRLLVVMPGGGSARIRLTMNGAPLTEREVEVERGLVIESFAMLLAGSYEARLVVEGREVGAPVRFTVAQYTLAPLSARLLEHKLDRAQGTLSVALAVESYAVPYDKELFCLLLDDGEPAGPVTLTARGHGRYEGRCVLRGDGPFKLRVTGAEDAARVAEVSLPGARKSERELIVVSELGQEVKMALLPEPGAVPVRGMFLSKGDYLATPVSIEDVVAEDAVLRAGEDLEQLTVALYEPASGRFEVKAFGDVKSGDAVRLAVPRPMAVVLVGCFVDGAPFEAFASVFAPEKPVALEVPALVAPGGELPITVRTGRDKKISVALLVKDERLVATDRPQTQLAASAKRTLSAARAGLGEEFRFAPLDEMLDLPPPSSVGSTAHIVVVTVSEPGRVPYTHRFMGEDVTIGRGPDNALALARPQLSKNHARVALRDGKLILVDLRSANGTTVNGTRISAPRVLQPRDRVMIGDITLTFEVELEPLEGAVLGGRFDAGFDDLDGATIAAAPMPTGARSSSSAATPARRPPPQAPVRPAAAPARAARDIERSEVAEEAARMPRASLALDDALDDGDADDLMFEDVATGESEERAMAAGPRGKSEVHQAEVVEPAEVRAVFPEVLFCGVVEVGDGEVVSIPVGGSLGAFAVEALFVDDGDFGAVDARVQVDKIVRVDLDVAPEIHPDDRVLGVLRVGARSGSATVRLLRDGKPVKLATADGKLVTEGQRLPSGTELRFEAGPGTWLASADDGEGHTDSMELLVGEPGAYRVMVRELRLLQKGDALRLDEDMLSLRVLPGIEQPFSMLAEATAGYEHLCCEQTAAKLLSAVAMYLTADKPALKKKAEEIIIAGVAREKQMHLRGRGFSMYPGYGDVNEYYTPKVVRYLWSLRGLADVKGLSAQLVAAATDGLRMADDVAKGIRMSAVPDAVRTVDDAYALVSAEPKRAREALEFVSRQVVVEKTGVKLKERTNLVAERALLAYAAATLFACGKPQIALPIANEVLAQLNEQGRLYSTVDSVAAIALMIQLRKSGIVGGAGALSVNGRRMTPAIAAARADQVEEIVVEDGVCMVEVTRLKEVRWAEGRAKAPLKVGFRGMRGQSVTRFAKGDRVDLVVSLPKGYQDGDLVHVCLPPSMAWIESGARVKRFTRDLSGRPELVVPVVVTHAILGKQRFAVAVRNMFEEERVATTGLVTIDAA